MHRSVTESLAGPRALEPSKVKDYLYQGESGLRKRHLSGAGGFEVTSSYTHLIDALLKTLFNAAKEKIPDASGTAIIATGGYGRRELNIRSDVDMTILYRKRITPGIEELTEKILYVLWDTGLDVGFSIRTVDECIGLARGDTKTMTALLDRRFLQGDASLYEDLDRRVKRSLLTRGRIKTFIERKMEETKLRHSRYGGSVYILEPNVKEGEGGLRDYHTAMWIVKASDPQGSDPLSRGLLSAEERATLMESLDMLLWIRNELHFETNRKTDQLSFDHQERIAGLLGFVDTKQSLAVEAFMQRYYKNATSIKRISGLIISRFLEGRKRSGILSRGRTRKVDDWFEIRGGLLTLVDKELFAREPGAMMKAFLHISDYGVDLDQGTKDLLLENIDLVDDNFRRSSSCSGAFLKVLKGDNVFMALNAMHELGFLERYIPEFGDISFRVQHDLYHVYTVDAHTLFAVRELERLRKEYKFEFPLLADLFEETKRRDLLMLGVLFHDIGKSLGRGHAEKGARLTSKILERLGLDEDETELVVFLVRNHLILADTAQYRDLHDDRLIVDFARKVGDPDRLNHLYLLTFADVRAVGPDVWNQWKAALFQELYFKAMTVMERGIFEVEEARARMERVRRTVEEIIREQGLSEEDVEGFFKLLPQRYFLSTPPERIAGHIRVVKELDGRGYLFRVRQDRDRHYTEFIVCTHDVHGLFAMITGVMAANSVDILGAQINTLRNGIVLDVLQVTDPYGDGLIVDPWKLKKIDADLGRVIAGEIGVEELVARKRPSILDRKFRPVVPTRVMIDNNVSDVYTVIDIHTQNRLGLLYSITSTLSKLGLYIHIAKVTTKGDEAADIFYVKDIFGQKIYYDARLEKIREELLKVLETGEGKGGE